MTKAETIAGHKCRVELSRDNETMKSITILVGTADASGWRRKDAGAKLRRSKIKQAVRDVLAGQLRAAWLLSFGRIRCLARYSELVDLPGGAVARRNTARVAARGCP